MAERLLIIVEKRFVPGWIILPIEYHFCAVQFEWFEWWLFFE